MGVYNQVYIFKPSIVDSFVSVMVFNSSYGLLIILIKDSIIGLYSKALCVVDRSCLESCFGADDTFIKLQTS